MARIMSKITGFSALLGANVALIGSTFIALGVNEAIKSNSSETNVIEEEVTTKETLTNTMVNEAIKDQNNYDNTTNPHDFLLPSQVKVMLGDVEYVVNLTKIRVEHTLGAIVWKGETIDAQGSKKVLEGKLSGFQTYGEQNIEKANAALAKLDAYAIEDAIRRTNGVLINPAIYPDQFTLPPTVNVEIDGVKIIVNLTKESSDTNVGAISWSSVAKTTVIGSNERSDIKGLLAGFWQDPLFILEKIINSNPTSTMKYVVGNFIIESNKLRDFGLTFDSLNLNGLENKITNLKITQQKYDFQSKKMVVKVSFDFVSAREKAEFIVKIDGFKEPKITLKSSTEIEPREFINVYLPDDFSIPSTVTTINEFAFALAHLNENFEIPDTVTTIKKGAFVRTTIPKDFKLPKAWENSIEDFGFRSAVFKGSLALPNTLTTISKGAFKDAHLPSDFTIPNSVTTIEYQAFSMSGKELPHYLQLPTNVNFQTIEREVFQHSIMNADFRIPLNVTTIEADAFNNSTFKKGFFLPKGLSIHQSSFDDSSVWPGMAVKTSDGKIWDWQTLTNQERWEQAKKGFEVIENINIYELSSIY